MGTDQSRTEIGQGRTAIADPIFATATDLAAGIRDRRLSAVEALEAHLDHIDRRNPAINAIITLDPEGALARAQAADEALACGEIWGPLHGVPMTIKDYLQTAGMRTTAGLPELADYVPARDAVVVARIRAAGAVIMGKTNCPGKGGGFHTDNPVFGRTNNPWDLERVPGGSSGGSAAAVAAGLSPLDIGSDGGGSLRVPAHYCGAYAFKATERRVSTTGHTGYDPVVGGEPAPSALRLMGTPGPIARSVDDLVLALSLIAGPDGAQWELPPASLEPVPPCDPRDLRLAWSDDFGVPVTRDTSAVLMRLAEDLRALGCRVEQERVPGFDADVACEAWGGLYPIGSGLRPSAQPDESVNLAKKSGLSPNLNEPHVRGRVRVMTNQLTEYLALAAIRDEMISRLETFFTRWDALICPVTVGPAFRHCSLETPMAVDEQVVTYWRAGISYSAPFNPTGHPSVVLPAGLSADGLPIGVQIVGPRWADMKVLSIARQVQEVVGPFRRPPGF